MQLMHGYVQKSTSTTWPRIPAIVSGRSPGVLNQSWVLVKLGAKPSLGSDGVLTPGIEIPTSLATGVTDASWCWRSAKRDGGRSEARRLETALELSSDLVGSIKNDGRLVSLARSSSKRTSTLNTIS